MTVVSLTHNRMLLLLQTVLTSQSRVASSLKQMNELRKLANTAMSEPPEHIQAYLDGLCTITVHPNVAFGTAPRTKDSTNKAAFTDNGRLLLKHFKKHIEADKSSFNAEHTGHAHCRQTALIAYKILCDMAITKHRIILPRHLTALLIARDMWEQGAFRKFSERILFSNALRRLADCAPDIFTTDHLRILEYKRPGLEDVYDNALSSLAFCSYQSDATMLAGRIINGKATTPKLPAPPQPKLPSPPKPMGQLLAFPKPKK